MECCVASEAFCGLSGCFISSSRTGLGTLGLLQRHIFQIHKLGKCSTYPLTFLIKIFSIHCYSSPKNQLSPCKCIMQSSLKEIGRRKYIIFILRYILISIITFALDHCSLRALHITSLKSLLSPAFLLGLICQDHEKNLHSHLCHSYHTQREDTWYQSVCSSIRRISLPSHIPTQVLSQGLPSCIQKDCTG